MRVLVLDYKDLWHPEAGGAQIYVHEVASVWRDQGHDVTIFTSRNSRPEEETVDGVHYVRRGNKYSVFHEARLFLIRRGDDFDVILDTVNQRPFLAHEVVGEKATAIVYHLGLDVWQKEFSAPLAFVGRYILEPEWMRRLNYAPRIVALSDSTSRSFDHYGLPCDDIVEPGGVDVEPVLDREVGRAPRIVFLGRLVENKRPLDAIRAVREIQQRIPEASLDVLGGGYLLEEARALASENVRVWGHVSEEFKVDILSRADLLLMTSVREGWGLVVNEAGARGVPTIGYDVPGLQDSVRHGETGLLTEESPAALADAAVSLLTSPDEWRRLSRNAAVASTSWSWGNVAEKLLTVMTSPPERPAWLRAHPELAAGRVDLKSDPSSGREVEVRQHRYNLGLTGVLWAAVLLGVVLRIYEALHLPWRDDEINYVAWTGQWFSSHLFSYIFQFQQHVYPPQSPYFANPPLAMWFFGVAIFAGKGLGVSALTSARLMSVVFSLVTNVMIWRVGRRWLSEGTAVFAAAAFALFPLAIVTGASAFIEPLLTLELVLALDAYLRLKDSITTRRTLYLGATLAASLLTKFSYGVVFFLIGLVALIHLVRSGHRRRAAVLIASSVVTPFVVWSGYRTPSQYHGVFSFLFAKYSSSGLVIDWWRYPLSLVASFPLAMLAAWLVMVVSPLAFPLFMRRAPRDILFVSALPLVGLTELIISAPTSWSYQLLPMVPLVLLVAGWTLRYFYFRPRRRSLWAALGGVMAAEFLFMFSPLVGGELSLSQSPLAWAARTLYPSIDLPYGTGSEPIPALMAYVNHHVPTGSRVAGTYVDPIMAQYARPGISVGFWSPQVPLNDLSALGYQYGVYVNHFVAPSSLASESVAVAKPLLRVNLSQGLTGELVAVPFPDVRHIPALVFSSAPLGRSRSATASATSVTASGTSLRLVGHFDGSPRSSLGVSDPATFGPLNRLAGVDLTVNAQYQGVVVSVELVSPQGGYLQYEIGVNPSGPEHLWIPLSMFVDNLGAKRSAEVSAPAHLRISMFPAQAGLAALSVSSVRVVPTADLISK